MEKQETQNKPQDEEAILADLGALQAKDYQVTETIELGPNDKVQGTSL